MVLWLAIISCALVIAIWLFKPDKRLLLFLVPLALSPLSVGLARFLRSTYGVLPAELGFLISLSFVFATIVLSVVLIVRLDSARFIATLLAFLCVVVALQASFTAVVISSPYFTGGAAVEKPSHCRWEGSLRVEIGGHVLQIPRVLLSSVTIPGRGYVVALECDLVSTNASAVFLQATTRGGRAFYVDWNTKRRLPTDISIHEAGYSKYDNRKRYEERKKAGVEPQLDENGFTFLDRGSRLFVLPSDDPGTSEGHFYVDCPKMKLPNGGHVCLAAYRYGDFDVFYRFSDAMFPATDWLALDRRFRAFVDGLSERQ